MREKTMKILLALALVLGLCTMTALAADDGITVQVDASAGYETVPEFVDGAVYRSLEDAVAAANAVAVSYTHLDVYKRQAFACL